MFTTAYQAPSSFRFSFEQGHPHHPLREHRTSCVVGVDALGPFLSLSFYGKPAKLERGASLETYVAGATGISRGSAYTIGSLLFKEVGPFELAGIRRVRSWRSRTFGGVHCVGVSGHHRAGGLVVAYFGAKDLLLRRVVYHRLRHVQVRSRLSTVRRHVNGVFPAHSGET